MPTPPLEETIVDSLIGARPGQPFTLLSSFEFVADSDAETAFVAYLESLGFGAGGGGGGGGGVSGVQATAKDPSFDQTLLSTGEFKPALATLAGMSGFFIHASVLGSFADFWSKIPKGSVITFAKSGQTLVLYFSDAGDYAASVIQVNITAPGSFSLGSDTWAVDDIYSVSVSTVLLDTDGTLAANSDKNIASQKAVKTYADTKLPSSYLDTDGTLAANSDTKIPSQKAVATCIASPGAINPTSIGAGTPGTGAFTTLDVITLLRVRNPGAPSTEYLTINADAGNAVISYTSGGAVGLNGSTVRLSANGLLEASINPGLVILHGSAALGWSDVGGGGADPPATTTLLQPAANTLALRHSSAEQKFLVGPTSTGIQSNAGELEAFDNAANVTVISPHAKDAPADLYRIAPGVDEMRRQVNPCRGVVHFIAADGREVWETFAEYNDRRAGETPLVFTDWDDVEAASVAKREQEIATWQARQTAHETAHVAWQQAQSAFTTAHAAWLAQPEETRALLGPEPQFTAPEPTFTEASPEPYTARTRPDWAHQVTREELDAMVPVAVMAHQLRVQLIVEGIDPAGVTAAVAAIPDAQTRQIAAAQWEYAPTIRRDHPLVASLAAQLSLSTGQVDEIFRQAAKR
jgi:hypothetical protein